MSPYEILYPAAASSTGTKARRQVARPHDDYLPRAIWLNPEPEHVWRYRQSTG